MSRKSATFAVRKKGYINKTIYMRSRTAEWFECKIRYAKTAEDGSTKRVTELYAVDALSFTEAEQRITEEMSAYISGEFEVADIKKAAYKEVFFADSDSADRWYKARLQFITIDEKTDKEKRATATYLVNAGSLPTAVRGVDELMSGTATDYATVSVAETQIMDVYEYRKEEEE